MDIGKQKRVIIVEPEPVETPAPRPKPDPARPGRSGGGPRGSAVGHHHQPSL
jgi:hypothetical protein